MNPVAKIILYEMDFNTSWAEWNALRRAFVMYDTLGQKERVQLSRFSEPTYVQLSAGDGLWKTLRSKLDETHGPALARLDRSAAALAALSLAAEPVNRAWKPPRSPVEAVMAGLRAKGAAESLREISNIGRGSFGSFVRVFRDCPAGVRDPLAELGKELGIEVPNPTAQHSPMLRSLLLIHDRVPQNAVHPAGDAHRALTARQAGDLLEAFTHLHRNTDSLRRGLFGRLHERIAVENPAAMRPHLGMLLDSGILTPGWIYREAPPDVVARWEQTILARPGNRASREELTAERRPALDDLESPRISDECRALPARGDKPSPADQPLRGVVDLGIPCPRCARPLVALLDLRLDDPRLASYAANIWTNSDPRSPARLRVPACEQCCGECIQLFASYTPSGDVVPASIQLHDEMNEEHFGRGARRTSGSQQVKPDTYKSWQRDALIFDPTPRLPTAPMAYALDHPGSSHLGGLPRWTQDPKFPACSGCERTMPFLARVSESELGQGDADLFAFWCPRCRTTAVIPQQS